MHIDKSLATALSRFANCWRNATFLTILGVIAVAPAESPASAATYSVVDQAGCSALQLAGGTSKWTAARCTIPHGATLTLSTGDTLTVPSNITLKVAGTIEGSGSIANFGRILLPLHPKGRISVSSGGSLVNKRGGRILSNGEISVDSGATLINSGFLHNQFASTFTVNGTLTVDGGVMSLSVSNNYNFNGTLEIEGTAYHDITLNGVVLVRIAATKIGDNQYQLTVCDYDKNIDGTADSASNRIGPGEANSACTSSKPATVASLAATPRIVLIQNDTTVASTNTQVTGTATISNSTTAYKNSRSAAQGTHDRYLGGTG
jgi:hypothetical protein